MRIWLLLGGLAGCDAEARWNAAVCEKTVDCGYGELYGWTDAAACEADATGLLAPMDTCSADDPGALRACAEAYAAVACADMYDPEALPEACQALCGG